MAYDYERERTEAIDAGNRALYSLKLAQTDLNSARNWGVFDMVGGGMISSLAKQSKMNNAKQHMEQAKEDLYRFSRELQDVNINLNLNLETGDFLSFADWFFDNLAVDWMVQSRIEDASKQVGNAIYQVESILRNLGGNTGYNAGGYNTYDQGGYSQNSGYGQANNYSYSQNRSYDQSSGYGQNYSYGQNNYSSNQYYDPSLPVKNKILAGVLCIVLGTFGVGNFYLGNIVLGILDVVFFWTGIPSVVNLIRGIIILASSDIDFANKYNCNLS